MNIAISTYNIHMYMSKHTLENSSGVQDSGNSDGNSGGKKGVLLERRKTYDFSI